MENCAATSSTDFAPREAQRNVNWVHDAMTMLHETRFAALAQSTEQLVGGEILCRSPRHESRDSILTSAPTKNRYVDRSVLCRDRFSSQRSRACMPQENSFASIIHKPDDTEAQHAPK